MSKYDIQAARQILDTIFEDIKKPTAEELVTEARSLIAELEMLLDAKTKAQPELSVECDLESLTISATYNVKATDERWLAVTFDNGQWFSADNWDKTPCLLPITYRPRRGMFVGAHDVTGEDGLVLLMVRFCRLTEKPELHRTVRCKAHVRALAGKPHHHLG